MRSDRRTRPIIWTSPGMARMAIAQIGGSHEGSE